MLASVLLLGPVWAVMVAIPVMLYRDRLRSLYVASCDTLTIFAAGFVYRAFAEFGVGVTFSANLIYGAILAGLVFYILDALINAVLLRLKYDEPLFDTLKSGYFPLIPSDAIAVAVSIATLYTTSTYGPAAALVLFTGVGTALISLHLIHTRQKENEALKLENSELRASVVGFAAGMVGAVGEKDGYTSRLAAASSVYAGDVGREFGFDDDRVNTLRISSLLQDVGMISIPERVSEAPSNKLNPLGRSHLERHTISGEEILAKAPGFEEAAKWVRWHHERMDGSGYPDHLKGQWLPLEARILAVSEVYASLVLDTPGSPALDAHDARLELTSQSGTGLDSEVVKALLRVLDREDPGYSTATGERFEFVNPAQEMVRKSPGLRVVGDE